MLYNKIKNAHEAIQNNVREKNARCIQCFKFQNLRGEMCCSSLLCCPEGLTRVTLTSYFIQYFFCRGYLHAFLKYTFLEFDYFLFTRTLHLPHNQTVMYLPDSIRQPARQLHSGTKYSYGLPGMVHHAQQWQRP